VLIFPASVTAALFPFFSYHGRSGGGVVSDVTSRTLKYLFLVLTPVTAVFVFFARDILQIWLGAEFAARSTVALQLLAVSFFLNALAMVPFTSVQALGRPDLKAYLDMVALPIYVVSTWWLLHHLGINGGALSKLLITVLDSGCLFFFSWKLKALSLRDFASGSLYRSMIASLALALAVLLIKALNLGLLLSGVFVVFAGLAYLAAFWKFAVEDDESASIQQMFRGFLRLPPRLSEASIEEAVTVGPLDR
jgi:O-antigen/teichoic acid export membrane protein